MQDKFSNTISLFLLAVCHSMPAATAAGLLGKDASTPGQAQIVDHTRRMTPQTLPFRLVGIVIAREPALSLAILEHEDGHQQRQYRQGDRVDGVLIKQILPDGVILDAADGVLSVPLQSSPSTMRRSQPKARDDDSGVREDVAQSRPSRGRHTVVRLDRLEVASALDNVSGVLRQVDLSPVMRFDEPAGLRISNIPADGILSRLGLRDGDIIKRVDDTALAYPEQAADFLRRVSEGGRLTLTVSKRRRTRQIVIDVR